MIKLLTFDHLFLGVPGVERGRGYREEEKREGDWGEFPFSLSMARILCNTVTQATHECQSENIAKYGVENQQNHNISSNDILVNVTKPEERSTWRVGLHKRVFNNL